jgi:hypothetical protein
MRIILSYLNGKNKMIALILIHLYKNTINKMKFQIGHWLISLKKEKKIYRFKNFRLLVRKNKKKRQRSIIGRDQRLTVAKRIVNYIRYMENDNKILINSNLLIGIKKVYYLYHKNIKIKFCSFTLSLSWCPSLTSMSIHLL